MKDGPNIAGVAALIGDPARANMLTALMTDVALTAGELAHEAGVAAPTASEHLAKLTAAGLVAVEKQGRHRYFRLAGGDVAHVLEGLMGIAQRTGTTRTRPGPREPALREARVCYDHLAGARAVAALAALGLDGDRLSTRGVATLDRLGIDVAGLARGRRPVCRLCLDWSERRSHLAGAAGAALLDQVIARGWATRGPGRVIRFSDAGGRAFDAALGIAPIAA